MGIRNVSISQEEPVHFRVQSLEPNPFRAQSPTMDLLLTLEIVKEPKSGISAIALPTEWVAPYLDALNEAITSQRIYWVDLDFSKARTFPPPGVEDSTPFRIFRAVQGQQIVPSSDPL